MESSVANGVTENKTGAMAFQDLDSLFLGKLQEWGKVQFAALLEEIDHSIRQARDRVLRVVRKRGV